MYSTAWMAFGIGHFHQAKLTPLSAVKIYASEKNYSSD